MLFPSVHSLDARLKNFLSHAEGIEQKRAVIDNWRKAFESGKILKRKEESIKSDFIQDIFTNVLGYSFSLTEKSWNLEKELKTQFDGKKPDASLGYFSHESDGGIKEDIRAVVEIKSPQVNLDKKQNRKNFTGSPVEQGFSYAYRIGASCNWVIVTNFLELRLYRASDINKYQSYTLSELTQPDKFQQFLFFLHEGQLFHEKEDSQIERLYLNRQAEQKTISATFYDEYHALRELLFFNLHRNNNHLDWRKLFAASQKIIDRIIFICFVKDLELVGDVLTNARKSSEDSFDQSTNNFWRQLLHLFSALDKGYERKRIPPFNGGLFRKDDFINDLKVRDEEILPFVEFAMKYDFHSQLDVSILGHIFEQSIADLEEMKASIQSQSPLEAHVLEELPELKTSKRKRDGIYYTPDYVTKYIVKEAVGEWLDDRKREILDGLGVEELPEASKENYMDVGKKGNPKISLLKKYYESYRQKLSDIKVLDMACGSGAFLTEVFDFLYDEQKLVNEELKKLNTPFDRHLREEFDPFGNGSRDEWIIKKNIILQNLHGVDLNPESVEITKLSLWLKTANRTESLADLMDNIKQGNSLIDDTEVAGENAFSWHGEFADIMQAGGFDVVVGNPPYFSLSKSAYDSYFEQGRFSTYQKGTDIYVLFYELGIGLLKENGNLSFITSNSWLRANYGLPLKELIRKETQPISLLEIDDKQIFEDATVESNILAVKKSAYSHAFPVRKMAKSYQPGLPFFENFESFMLDLPESGAWVMQGEVVTALMTKIESKSVLLGNLSNSINYGIKTGLNEAFIIDAETRRKLIDADPKNEEILKPILRGRDVQKYKIQFENQYLINAHNGLKKEEIKRVDIVKEYPKIYSYLKKFKPRVTDRQDQGEHWANLRSCAYLPDFEKPKIIWGEISDKPKFTFDAGDYYQEATTFFMTGENLKYLLGILNSKLSEWYFHLIGTTTGMGTNRWKKYKIEQFPIADISTKRMKEVEVLVDRMLDLKKQPSDSRTSYLTLLTSNFPPKKPLSNKLKNQLWKLEFVDVLAELKKSEILIPARRQKEWLELFFEQREKAENIEAQIEKTETGIDALVYELYDLGKEEIAIIETG